MIREFVESDLSSIWRINQENVPAVGESSELELEAIAQMSALALVVECEGEVAGFCFVLPPATEYDSPNYQYFCDRYEDFIYLDRVAFAAQYQGRGFGAALYREVERRTSAGAFTLEVNVLPPNERSMRFHLREGFIEVDQLETRPGKIVSLMVKKLSSGTVNGHE
jgi:predicted GNAT superfamily acetyltransferase